MKYKIFCGKRSFEVAASTFESVWLSQKCWFSPGSKVLIVDESGNQKTFVKEVI